ncbi:MAG TPA: 4Fe-4S dicluster domain-containing protein [Thermoanaerobaculia bacterium]|nr:4Fe-4S dicluster domain-containing protein [Thermoanaerobaculia bacterium]
MLPRVASSIEIRKPALQKVVANLGAAGFTVMGPVVRDGAIMIGEIASIDQLPAGWVDDQRSGSWRLEASPDAGYFTHTLGPDSWKRLLYPPRTPLFSARPGEGGIRFSHDPQPPPRYACLGVRSCDLQAIALQDRVFINGRWTDPSYAGRRAALFVLAVHCTRPSANCFCASMETGPRAAGGFDLALTELPDGFVIYVGSEAGSEAMRDTAWSAATAYDLGRARTLLDAAERRMPREVRTEGLAARLFERLDHPRWKELGERCLSCGNCTMVCPTCFCSTVDERLDFRDDTSVRERVWDSCFSTAFSHVHGGNIRPTVASRYRQFVTHKFASWKEQFGAFGCVGCGRCIAWCPAGIDLAAELETLASGRSA